MAIECKFWGINFASDDISSLALKLNEIYNKTVVAKVKVILFTIYWYLQLFHKY